jgi:F-type H+-transporting ATPase subunit epsilon
LGSGLLRIEQVDGSKRQLFVSGGFAQMIEDKLTVLTEEAIEPSSLDVTLAESAAAAVAEMTAANAAEIERKQRAAHRARAMARVARRHG